MRHRVTAIGCVTRFRNWDRFELSQADETRGVGLLSVQIDSAGSQGRRRSYQVGGERPRAPRPRPAPRHVLSDELAERVQQLRRRALPFALLLDELSNGYGHRIGVEGAARYFAAIPVVRPHE